MERKKITTEDWEEQMITAKITKSFMNSLVMDVLVFDGYIEAARSFQEESRTEPEVDLTDVSITERVAIINAIKSRNLEDAMTRVNALNPELPNAKLHLKNQKFIELIREEKIEEALKYAQDEIAPFAENHEAFRKQFEINFTLLCVYPSIPSSIELLGNSQWYQTSNEVNAAITGERGPELQHLLNVLSVTQNKMDARGFEYPHFILSTGQLAYP